MEKGLSNKTEYIYADYFRLICAIGIVALHLDPFYDINEYVNFFIGSVLTRLCVPFFFLLSGFFLKDKLLNWGRLSKYVVYLIKLYSIYTILYLPIVFYEFKDNGKSIGEDILDFIKKFLFVGSYGQLWYFLALIFAVVFLYLVKTKLALSDKMLTFVCIILYLIGLFFRVYDKPIRDTVDAIKIVALYDSVFKTTRNGLFFGVPFVFAGNMLWERGVLSNRRKCVALFWVSFLLLMSEAIFVRTIIGARQLDMLLILPATSILFVVLVLTKNIEATALKFTLSSWCRKLSVYIFGLHLLIFFFLSKVFKKVDFKASTLVMFTLVLVINFAIGIICIKIENLYRKNN